MRILRRRAKLSEQQWIPKVAKGKAVGVQAPPKLLPRERFAKLRRRRQLANKAAIVVAALLLVASPLIWYLASPQMTLVMMKRTISANDPTGFEAFVDWPTFAQNFGINYQELLIAQANPSGKLDPMVCMATSQDADHTAGSISNAANVMSLVMGDGVRGVVRPRETALTNEDAQLVRDGFSRFQLRNSADGNAFGDITFDRIGWRWKIVRFSLGSKPSKAC